MHQKITRHWGLMNGMSLRAGVDLGSEFIDGKLSRSGLRRGVYRCTQCKQVPACEQFLAQPANRTDEIPDYCRNKSMILALKRPGT
jgi:hypothetical protein